MVTPYVPFFTTSRYRVDAMLGLAEPQQGDRGIDLGSGDGRIVIAFAQKGVSMTGYELDERLATTSQAEIKVLGLPNAHIEMQDFWQVDLSPFDIITIYPMPDIMELLESKLRNEGKKGARILTNYYQLPTWQPEKTKDHIYLYRK